MNNQQDICADPKDAKESMAAELSWPVAAGGLATLVFLLYLPVLKALVIQWWQDPNYSHGFLVPIFVAYVLWQERSKWEVASIRPSDSGLLVMAGALLFLIAGTLGAELFTTRLSLLIMIGGIILYLAGGKMLKAIFFPLAFLVFMIPLPALLYNQLTFPLQLEASRFASVTLELLHVPVLREGNLLQLPHYTLEVVDACSGIRSLMALMALAIVFGYLAGGSNWVRVALVFLTIPIAIVSNGVRIVGTGVATYSLGPQWAEGFFHLFSGWLVFVCALVLLFIAYRVLVRFDSWRVKRFHD